VSACGEVGTFSPILTLTTPVPHLIYTERAAFEAAAGALVLEDFNEAHTEAALVDFGDFTAQVGRHLVLWSATAGMDRTGAIWSYDETAAFFHVGQLVLNFDEPTYAVGLDILSLSSGLISVQPSDFAFPTEQDIFPEGDVGPRFFGVISELPFTRLDIRWRYATDAVVFDNLVYSGTLVTPTLSVGPAGLDGLTVSWTPETPGFLLQLSQELIEWTDAEGATNPPVTLPIAEGEALFFRLTNP
jgi:hypothetical protein